MARRTVTEFQATKARLAAGVSIPVVARELGIPRGTVRTWSRRDTPPLAALRHAAGISWSVGNPDRYCYLLGAYLGDGTVSHPASKSWTLRIINDRRYPEISREILDAMSQTFPDSTPRIWPASHGQADLLQVGHPAIPRAFPQHGPGRKHTRPIQRADWQRELTHEHPDALIRGLIHSDGCRCINHVKTTLPSGRVAEYEYVRYFFTNHSADIREIFVEHCELLGVRVPRSNHRNLSIAHRSSVAALEQFVGPKT